MLGQYPEKLKVLRQIQEIAKKRAKELVKSSMQIDLESIKAEARAEFEDDAQIYINFLEKEITTYRHKLMAKDAELLRVADMYRRTPAEAPLSPHSPFTQAQPVKQNSTEIQWVYKQAPTPAAAPIPKVAIKAAPVAVPKAAPAVLSNVAAESALPAAAKKDAKDRAGRNARSGVSLNLEPIRKRAHERFPAHVDAYLTYYERVFNQIKSNIHDDDSVRRLAAKRGAELVKKCSHFDEEKLQRVSLEFGQYAELYCTTYRHAFNERKALHELKAKLPRDGGVIVPAAAAVPAAAVPAAPVSESQSKSASDSHSLNMNNRVLGNSNTEDEEEEAVLVVPKSFLKQYPQLLPHLKKVKSENQGATPAEEKTRKRVYLDLT